MWRLSSSPTFLYFSYFLGVVLLFFLFFSENSYFSFSFALKCHNNFFLSGNARVAGECTNHTNIMNFWFIIFISLSSATFKRQKKERNMLCPKWMFGYTQNLLIFAIKFLHFLPLFSYIFYMCLYLKLLLFSYFFIWSHLKACWWTLPLLYVGRVYL